MAHQECSWVIELVRVTLPAILVILGWIVVNKLAVKREMDKSRREMISTSADGLCDSIDKLVEDSYAYHSAERDQKLEVQIKIALSDIPQRAASLNQLTQDTEKLTNCLKAFVKLRQAISGKHFEDEHSGAIHNGPIHEEIAESMLGMKRCLVDLKHSQFPLLSKK